MRVLHLINRPQVRGAQQFAARLAAELEGGEVQNAICSLYPAGDGDERYETGDLQVFRLDVEPTVLDRVFRVEPRVALGLRRVLREFEPDIVVGHGTDTLRYAALAKLMRRQVRTVYMNIGLASHWASGRARTWFNRFWLRGIDCSVSVSEYVRRDFIEHYGFDESRAVYIPNAVLLKPFDDAAAPSVRQEVRSALGFGDGDVVIGTVGRLSPEKGQDTLIRAAASLVRKGLDVRLVLVGDGPERQQLETLAETEGIAANVTFAGVRQDVPRLLRGFDIFALTSTSEGMPGVLIEAGISGLPSVSFDVGGVTEVVNDSTGLVVPAGDFDGLVQGLEALATRADWRRQMGERARTWCRGRFDLEVAAGQFLQVFNQLLTGGPLHIQGSATLNADNQ